MKPFMITIPEPCHENWNAMTPVEKGRFCASCATAVMDFSTMTDAQIQSYLSKSGSNVCGRFEQSQVNRALEVPKKENGLFKHLWKLLLPGFFFAPKAFAQKIPTQEVKGKDPLIRTNPKPMILGKIATHIIPVEKEGKMGDTIITDIFILDIKETYVVVNDAVKLSGGVSSFTLHFGKVEKGEYQATLTDTDGKKVQQSSFYIPGADYDFHVDLDKRIVAGGYLLRVTNAEGKLFYNGKIVAE